MGTQRQARPGPRALQPSGPRRRPTRRERLVRRAAPAGALVVVAAAGVLVLAGGDDKERELVTAYAEAWEQRDYAGMYQRTTQESREARTAVTFARQHREALATATATSVRFGEPAERGDGVWELPAQVATRVFGPVRATVRLELREEGDDVAVAWDRHLVFPGLQPGESLSRRTTMPPRGDLVARDGSVLAAGEARASTVPGASAIVGTIGPIPGDRREELRALGVPEDAQVGINGLERIFDDQLVGRPGGELLAGDRVLARSEPRGAGKVRTTIAPRVQEAAVAALGGRLGGVVAMRPGTGEIVAVAGIGFSGLQPPGSTFKIITAAAALDAGVVKTSDRFEPATSATISGVELQNANEEVCGGTFTHSFAESCNSVFGPLGVKVGPERLVRAAERFGFNAPPAIPGAATSTIPQPGEIGDDLAVGASAIGQGRVQATPLQMALVAATIALRGRRPVPTLDGRRIGERSETTEVVPAGVAQTVARLMRAVVKEGTGRAAALPGVGVAGKTGTAELKTTQGCEPQGPSAATQEDDTAACAPDDHTDTTAWFAAYAPLRDPEIAVAVMLVEAGAGGDSAAPAARQVLQAALQ